MQNRLSEKRNAGRTAIGFNLRFPSPDLVEFMGYVGFDYVFIDAEHFAFGIETIQSIVRAAQLTGMGTMARVPKNDQELILSYLETGVLGIMVPHTKSADDARAAVKAVKYYPLGRRGAGGMSRAGNYGLTRTATDHIEHANRDTLVITLIEDLEGIERLTDILAVEGVDCLDIGPSDLAMSMGFPGRPDHPEVKKRAEDARRQILAAGRQLIFPVETVEEGREALAAGAKFIEFSLNDVLARVSREFLSQLRTAP